MKYSFLSPNLKYNNGLIYYLNMNELSESNYKENNYYIEEKDINKKCKINDNVDIDYELIYSKFDDNIVIEFNIDEEIDNEKILNYMFKIQEKVKGVDDLLIVQEYNKYKDIFKKFENNIIN